MPSELSKRLDDFRTKNKVAPVTQKVSFLFDASRAVGLDILSLAVIARKSLLDLAEKEPSLESFEDVFSGSGKSVEFMSQTEMEEFKERISRLFTFLSGHFATLDCQQCIEYLIQKYQIHVYFGEQLILFALPYHDTPHFGSLIKLIPFFKHIEKASPSESRWMFLRNVHKTGSPLSRMALIRMCRSSEPVLRSITDHVSDCLRHGAYNQPLLSFVNVLLLEVLSEFTSIKFDISVPLFSLCRLCFKASHLCEAAFFVGLSLATQAVCVADVRNDALAVLFSRCVATCPVNKLHALLMALVVVSERRSEEEALPHALVESICKQMDSWGAENVVSSVEFCVETYTVDFSILVNKMGANKFSQLVHESSIAAVDKKNKQSSLVVAPKIDETAKSTAIDSSSDSSNSDDESESRFKQVRTLLTGLIKSGSAADRTAALRKYASVNGATRYCIRLSGLVGSLELLALSIKSNKSDKGFLPTLISVLESSFQSADPKQVMEQIFINMQRSFVTVHALDEIAKILRSPGLAPVFALFVGLHEYFTVNSGAIASEQLWKTVAVVTSLIGEKNKSMSRLPLIQEWKTELVTDSVVAAVEPEVVQFSTRFLEIVNISDSGATGVDKFIAILICSITFGDKQQKAGVTHFANKIFGELSVLNRTLVVARLIRVGSPVLLRKIVEIINKPVGMVIGEIVAAENTELIGSVAELLAKQDCLSIEQWSLLAWLIKEAGVRVDAAGLLGALRKDTVSKAVSAGWKSVPVWLAHQEGDLSIVLKDLIDIVVGNFTVGGSNIPLVETQMETLLTVLGNEGLPKLYVDADGQTLLMDQLSEFVKFAETNRPSVSDTFVITLQSVCSSLLGLADAFETAWTCLIKMFSSGVARGFVLVLLHNLIRDSDAEREDVEASSKQLAQVLLGLVQLVSGDFSSAASSQNGFTSWTTSGDLNSDDQFSALVESCVTSFALNCNLRRLHKFYAKLLTLCKQENKQTLSVKVYASVCAEGGAAVVLALLPIANDVILDTLRNGSLSKQTAKRKIDNRFIETGLAAIRASCVEELPSPNLVDFIEIVSSHVVPSVSSSDVCVSTCVALANICDSDNVKLFTKLLMGQSLRASADTQVVVLEIVLALWKHVGEGMVPALTEVTVFLNELFQSDEEPVAEAALRLVKEIDRITGESIEEKLQR